MRLENLPDGGHGKVIWSRERRGDGTRKETRDNVTPRRGGDVPERRYWVFHLGVTEDTYHWDVLVTYHWDVIDCFIWDMFETSWRRTDGTSPLCPHETSSRRTNKTSWRRTTETSWRRSTETSLGVSFETYLRRHWDVQRDVVTTLPWRLVAGWILTRKFNVHQLDPQKSWPFKTVFCHLQIFNTPC